MCCEGRQHCTYMSEHELHPSSNAWVENNIIANEWQCIIYRSKIMPDQFELWNWTFYCLVCVSTSKDHLDICSEKWVYTRYEWAVSTEKIMTSCATFSRHGKRIQQWHHCLHSYGRFTQVPWELSNLNTNYQWYSNSKCKLYGSSPRPGQNPMLNLRNTSHSSLPTRIQTYHIYKTDKVQRQDKFCL